MLHRLGLHELVVRNAFLKTTPSSANLLMFGVFIFRLPLGPQSFHAASSAIKTIKLGCKGFSVCGLPQENAVNTDITPKTVLLFMQLVVFHPLFQNFNP
jgi:hypothetical protein